MQYSNVKDTYFKGKMTLRTRDKLIDLSTPIVMGILNVTPDSFYSSSRLNTENEVLKQAEKMLNDGATILDIGGYSSRPGAEDISVSDEISRIAPIFDLISKTFPEAILSIDTFRSEVAEEALRNGGHMINDISGIQDEKIMDVAVEYNAAYVLMHMRGTPQTMMDNTSYDNLFNEMINYFSDRIDTLRTKGVKDIVIDPGFGFAKTIDQNHQLLRNLNAFNLLDLPLLAGVSRKSMIYKKLNTSPEESLNGTIALNAIALNNGAKILRVHDVKEAVELIKLLA